MQLHEEKIYSPIRLTLDTEDEARELLGILTKVCGKPPELVTVQNLLREKLGVPMKGLYSGELQRSS